ncbi:MAG: leucyl aminopeptidase family protein [Actinomycetia bacterium]|nr:leucyl aminopeptidase family protein [Actinomycetes bacterium]
MSPRPARPRPALPRPVQALLGDRTENIIDPALPHWSVVDDLAGVRGDREGGQHAPVLALGVRAPDPAEGSAAEAVVAGVGAVAALRQLGVDAAELVATHTPSTRAGSLTQVALATTRESAAAPPIGRIVLVGLGEGSPHDIRAAAAAVGRVTRDCQALVLAFGAGAETAAVEGVTLGSWSAPSWRADGPVRPSGPPHTVLMLAGIDVGLDEAEIQRSLVRCRATLIARGLGLTPSNIKNPAWVAAAARTVARRSGLSVKVWDERDLHREGFGGLLAVGGGSATPPRLVQLDYTPKGAPDDVRRVVLVGKGITFDTGGLNVKPPDGMVSMKTDMLGAAVVLAVLGACRALEVPVAVTGLLALAENQISGESYRPSDVVTQYGGRTVEIGNTDAEGRIVLADALAYATEHLAPDLLVDIATLTGAARVALARSMAAIFGTDDALVDGLREAGQSTGETFWRLPLVDDYREALNSDVADLSHIAPAVGGGAITAALFLREFAQDVPWAHLDIAGPGRSDVDAGILAKGATGYGARAVLAWLAGLR